MSARSPRSQEISDFLDALRARSERSVLAPPQDNADLLAWKSSLLDRIAAESDDPEAQAVADNARRQLDEKSGGEW